MRKFIKLIKLILINLLIFFSILYLIEIAINIYSGNFLKKTRYQHLNDLRIKHNEKFFYNFFPYKLLKEETSGFIESQKNIKNKSIPFFYLGPKNDWRNLINDNIRIKIETEFKNEMIKLNYL